LLQVCIRDGRLDTAVYGDTSGGWLEVRQFHDDQATTEGAKRVIFAANLLAGKNDRLPRQARGQHMKLKRKTVLNRSDKLNCLHELCEITMPP
jgi:hypothetical protein